MTVKRTPFVVIGFENSMPMLSLPYTSAISLNRRMVDLVAAAAGVLKGMVVRNFHGPT